MAEVVTSSGSGCRLWAGAVEQFLAAKPLSPNARRSYAFCLGAVVSDLGGGTAMFPT